jgi:hypothetical protein
MTNATLNTGSGAAIAATEDLPNANANANAESRTPNAQRPR